MNTSDANSVLAALFAETPDGVVLYDLRGDVLAANEVALAMSGYRFEELTGKSYRDMVAGDGERIELAVRSALAGGRDHFECDAKRKDGTAIPVECYVFPARDRNGEPMGIFVQSHDIGDLKAAEESLAVNQQRFRSLFEFHPDGILELKADGKISRVNVAFESETGFYTEQVVGKPWTELLAPESCEQAAQGLTLAMRGEAVEHDSLLLDRLGNRIDVALKLVPVHVRDAIAGAYAVFKNVTAQKTAERTIAQQAERVRRLYMVAAARSDSVDEQIDATLRMGLELFQFDAAFITALDGDRVRIRNSVGENSPILKGAVYPASMTFARHLSAQCEMLVIPDIDRSQYQDDPARMTFDALSYVALRLSAGTRVFGSLFFAGLKARADIGARDRDLIALIGLFVSAALERAEHGEHIEQLAFNDALTGLPNRVLFADRIANTIATARRYNRGFAVMYLDLDRFKAINDTCGHLVGDDVLKGVAERLRSTLRESDTIARFGGDEFVILEPVVDGPADSADLARKLHTALQQPLIAHGTAHNVQASIGIALFPNDATTIEGLMEAADGALYRAKREGRNRWFFANQELARESFRRKKS